MKNIINTICIGFGFLFFGIGAVGVVLPILPTTPFLILSGVFFAKGSNKLHEWFLSTNLYKKYMEDFIKTKEMTKAAKIKVLCMLTVLFGIGFMISPIWHAKALIIVVAAFHYYYFIFKIKTREITISEKREHEKAIMHEMMKIYCKGNKHCDSKKQKDGLCTKCEQLLYYSNMRTDKCPFMETKTFCSACKIHCYQPDKKDEIKKVMRYSGPRMLFIHPILTIKHGLITMGRRIKTSKD